MKSDFLIAITQLSAEKNLSKEIVIEAIEAALVSAYRKDNFAANQNILVKINPSTGGVTVWAEKIVVELPSDSRRDISLDEARQIKPDTQIGEVIEVEATPHNAGRIAAQTAKQVILQRLHEAEHSAIFEEYTSKEGDVITGIVQRIEHRQMFIDLGRTEAVLPAAEQMRNERYRVGQRLKVYLLEVIRSGKGPQLVVSRSHPDLLRRLFELEIPEIFNGIVEIKAIAREAGYRSKVAVATRQEGVDPVGCCVGLRGIRIQNIVSELNGERIDVVMWDPDASVLITNALSPARILDIHLDDAEEVATAVVPDQQLSLAIGKEGQNVRLAAKLTGWRIDIKSASDAEAEKLAEAKLLVEEEEEATVGEELPAEIPATADSTSAFTEPAEEAAKPLSTLEAVPLEPLESQAAIEKPQLRFAEDILVSVPTKPEAKSRKKKKKGNQYKKSADDGIKLRKLRRESEIDTDTSDEDY
ncbi:MAG TPA: transcription termination/antitermination protein NusA [Dehalococcoidia bacterium]|nr:transcription termination/antitermination protein NusA [Dehalococcoidia bacterium]